MKIRVIRRSVLATILSLVLGQCASTIWDQVDPQFESLQASARTDWKANDVVGFWVCQSAPRPGLPARRITMLVKPDRTARVRIDGLDAGLGTWTYDGKGVWRATPDNSGEVLDRSAGMYWLPLTVRYTGRYLLVDAPWNAGVFSMGGVVTNRQVFVRADDDQAVRQTIDKRF